jgi:NAD(P)-dependent dehydrogenase (short-subunit alcohol dehydrogenase family)
VTTSSEFAGRSAFVTGAGSGMGAAIACELAAHDYAGDNVRINESLPGFIDTPCWIRIAAWLNR